MALAERMVEWAEGYKAQGVQQGVQAGVQEGRRAEAVAMLERVLIRRFGEVPERAKQRIQGVSADIIETWFDRALDAPSLASVFGDAPPPPDLNTAPTTNSRPAPEAAASADVGLAKRKPTSPTRQMPPVFQTARKFFTRNPKGFPGTGR